MAIRRQSRAASGSCSRIAAAGVGLAAVVALLILPRFGATPHLATSAAPAPRVVTPAAPATAPAHSRPAQQAAGFDAQDKPSADDTRAVRARIAEMAAIAEQPATDSVFAAIALSDPVPAVREEAIRILSERGGSMAAATLAQALEDPSSRVRKAAIRSLALDGGPEAERVLSMGLQSPDAALRRDVVDALGLLGSGAAQRNLPPLLLDPDQVVRQAAADWLAEYSPAKELR